MNFLFPQNVIKYLGCIYLLIIKNCLHTNSLMVFCCNVLNNDDKNGVARSVECRSHTFFNWPSRKRPPNRCTRQWAPIGNLLPIDILPCKLDTLSEPNFDFYPWMRMECLQLFGASFRRYLHFNLA